MLLLTNGDSWTFGSEIVAPEFLATPGEKGHGMGNRLIKDFYDTDTRNDYYRIPRIWPTLLAENLDANNINIAWPARSNDSILETTINWLLKNYIVPQRPTSDLIVVIGWSSLERKNVIIQDDLMTYMQTIWPAMTETSFYSCDAIKKYFKFHVQHLWTEYEYIARFIEQNFKLHMFCNLYNIKYYCFNAFYEMPSTVPDLWEDINIKKTIDNWTTQNLGGWVDPLMNWDEKIQSLKSQWATISSQNFIFKDKKTFKTYVKEVVDINDRMINWHPSPQSHQKWAEFLHKYIIDDLSNKSTRFKNYI